MELLQLHYFRTVARLEHMTKAAEELRVAQPALSMTISRLEKDLGVPLFDRLGRQIRLNAFGRAFLAKVDVALTALDEGKREVTDMAGAERGTIYFVTSTLDRLSEPLAAFRTLHPDISFRITQASMNEMGSILNDGEVDLCLTSVPLDQPGIRELPILGEQVYIGVPLWHPLANRKSLKLQEVDDEPFICYKAEHPLRKMNDDYCHIAGISRNVVCEVDEPAGIISLISAGIGVAFVGCCAPAPNIMRIPIEHPVCRRTFRIAWLENRYLSKAANTFKDFLVQYFSELEQKNNQIIVS